MSLISDRLGDFRSTTGESEAALLAELRCTWRDAFTEETEAWKAWCAGEGSHERFVAALDREQAAARALASCHAGKPVAGKGSRDISTRGRGRRLL